MASAACGDFPFARTPFVLTRVASVFRNVAALHHTLPSLTVAWSLLAFAFFAAGLALRDCRYRLAGLALLGLSVGRVFFVDVWAIAALWRILSFVVLGLVLLVIGYAYNRFEEKLRQWF